MIFEVALGVGAASNLNAVLGTEAGILTSSELVRGAIGGAFVIGVAFLAGFAVFRRSSAGLCALLMVLTAAALEFSWLGLFTLPSPKIMVLLQGAFAASVLIYISATIRAAKYNPLLGGFIFAGALTMIGIGVINFLGRVEAEAIMLRGLLGVGIFAAILTIIQSFRGDQGARLLLPGVFIVFAAPFTGHLFGPEATSLTPHALFTFGVLTASLVALMEGGAGQVMMADMADVQPSMAYAAPKTPEEKMLVSENQLAQVLDYSGVAVWDWSDAEAHQTESFGELLDTKQVARLAPDQLRDLVHQKDQAKFEADVFGLDKGDGSFDVAIRLHNDDMIRMRGARAIDEYGNLERLVVFAEKATDSGPKLWDAAAASNKGTAAAANAALFGAAAGAMSKDAGEKASATAGTKIVSKALENDQLKAAFQPIVSLKNNAVIGYEALLRPTPDAKDFDDMSTEDIVAKAETEGRGSALAALMLDASASFLASKLTDRKRKDLFVAFNVSYAQIRSHGFVEMVEKAISTHSLKPKSLVVELTEEDAVTDEKAAGEIFRKLTDAGAALAFDDFGAGFSSLSNLHKFSFDYLKVDKSFIDKMSDDSDASKIVAAVAGLGSELGLKVIAEGLETKALAESAFKNGCQMGQGYLFGQPEIMELGDDKEKDASASIRDSLDKVLKLEPEDRVNSDEKEAGQEKSLKNRFWSNDLR